MCGCLPKVCDHTQHKRFTMVWILSRAVLWDRDLFLLRTVLEEPPSALFSTGPVRALFEPLFGDP